MISFYLTSRSFHVRSFPQIVQSRAERYPEKERSQLQEEVKDLLEALEKSAVLEKQKIKDQQEEGSELATDPAMQNVVVDVEKDLLYQIMLDLRDGRLTEEEAQKLAQEFLSMLPIRDKRDLLDKLFVLSQNYPSPKRVYLKYSQKYSEEDRSQPYQL